MKENTIYEFHRSYDKITLNAVERILKIPSLKRSREYFHIDFLGDIGIINYLRKDFLNSADFSRTFDVFQNSRLEPKSHRYESLFALLVIAAAGTVIGGVILDIYHSEKEKVFKLVNKNILNKIVSLKDKKKLNKFCNLEPTEILEDLIKLKNCYVSRLMLEEKEIKEDDYFKLVNLFLNGSKNVEPELLEKHNEYKIKYNKSDLKIDENYIILAIKSYAKGTVIKYLEKEDITIPYDKNIKTANIIKGLPASSGFVKGKSHLFSNNIENKKYDPQKNVLCINSKEYSPELIELFTNYDGVVTWNSGMTGHIPVICRGMGKACVIIEERDVGKLKDNDDIMLSGNQGIIFTGIYVEQ